MTDQAKEQSKVPMPGLFFDSWNWKDPSVFIKRAATRSVIFKGLGFSQQAYRWKNIHLCTACEVVKNGILVFGIMYASVG